MVGHGGKFDMKNFICITNCSWDLLGKIFTNAKMHYNEKSLINPIFTKSYEAIGKLLCHIVQVLDFKTWLGEDLFEIRRVFFI